MNRMEKRQQEGKYDIIQEKKDFGIKQGVTSKGNVHVVIASKGPVAVGTFPRSRSQTFFDTIFAEDMSTGFDCSVFKVAATNSAQRQ